MEVGLRREDVLCRSEWSVGLRKEDVLCRSEWRLVWEGRMCSANQSGGWFENGRCALPIRVEVGLRREDVLCRSEWRLV